MERLRVDPHSVISCKGHVTYGNNEETSASRRAFERGDLLRLSAFLPCQLGVTEAYCRIHHDNDGTVTSLKMVWNGRSGANDIWTCLLLPKTLETGLYFLRVDAESLVGNIMTVRDINEGCHFAFADNETYTYQLTISDFRYQNPDWICGGTIYQVFVDRFYRGSETPIRSDVIYNTDWENGMPQYPEYPGAPLENNMFFGGNLDGVTAKLDYIASLGVNCIYLSPIFKAYSNHKYDTGNYMEIDEMFGGEAAFKKLISEAKVRGIRIILDGVFNHTGDDSLYFNRRGTYDGIGAYQSEKSPYYAWFDFQNHPEEYTCWWNIKILPRIHTSVSSCRDYFLAPGGVIEHYAKMGIGGMRLDVVDELPDEFVTGIKAKLNETVSDAILYGEVWEDASNKIAYGKRRKYFQGEQLDGVMNYRLRVGLIEYLRYHNTAPLYYALCEVMPNAPRRVQDTQMNLFGSHDTERILTSLAGEKSGGYTNEQLSTKRMSHEERMRGIQMLKNAYTIMATLPGVPLIYYGDEVGMEGYSDPFNRMPFPWHKIDEDVLGHYRALGKLRKESKAYKAGAFALYTLSEDLLIFSRSDEKYRYVTIVNNGNASLECNFTTSVKCVLTGETAGSVVVVPACCSTIIRCKENTVLQYEYMQ